MGPVAPVTWQGSGCVRSPAESIHLVAATAGFISYVFLWATVVWGVLLRRGWSSQSAKYSSLYATHMTLALVGLTLGWVHAFTQLANPVGTVFLIDEFIPFANARDPVGIGLGVIATEIMTALAVSVPLQRRLGYTRWRAIHALSYASFTLIAGHVILSGSEGNLLVVKVPVIALWASTIVLWFGVAGRSRAVARRDSGSGRPATVTVDPSRCSRFGFCEQEAPEIFSLRSDGRLAYKANVEPDQVEAVARAAKVCPARAIRMKRGEQATSRLS
jgi:ferredoxin/DMSO/TMAO reductase YedYZ heme-binding membrane subunit